MDMSKAILPKDVILDQMYNVPIPSEVIEIVNKKIIEAIRNGEDNVYISFANIGLDQRIVLSLERQLVNANYTVEKAYNIYMIIGMWIRW